MTVDFTNTSTEQLIKHYRFHLTDVGTQTFEEECRRMFMIQEIGQELRSRGIDPLSPEYIPDRPEGEECHD